MPEARIIVDYTPSGRGGAALLITSKLRVSEVGTSQFGGAVWATVHTAAGSIRVASLHAPNTKEERFDCARLDRFYLTNRGEWCDSIKQVKHYSDQLLSDHIPISMDLQLVQDDDANWKPRSYFKMNSSLFHKPEVLEAVKETWEEHPPFCRSSQKKWELAWGRVKQILRQERANNQLETRELDDLRREVQDLRIRSEQEELSSEAIQILKNREAEIHIRETREAHIWKVRSKDRWLKEGEAPSKYFYLQLKAKFSREKITVLENVSGETMTKHLEILHEVQEYYRELYKRGSITPQVTHARDEVLRHLTRRITAVEDDTLIIIPTPEEIDSVVNGLSLGKNPGLDGITAEALRLVWTLIKLLYEKRLKHWSFRLLSWPERLLVIRSILRALLGYTLLSLGINNAGIKELENLSRQFLWGWTETGAGKKSLLAWDVLSQPKRDGGLGWGRLDTLAQAHLLRNILSLMRPDQDIWTLILQRILHTRVDSSRHPMEIKGWTAQEFLLGLKSLKTPRSEFTNALLKTWFQARKFLRWKPEISTYPIDLTPRKIEFMLERYMRWQKPDVVHIMKLLKRSRFASGTVLQNGGLQRTEHSVTRERWLGMDRAATQHHDTWSPPTHFLRAFLHKDSIERPPLMTRWGRDGNPQEETNSSIDTALQQANVNPAMVLLIMAILRQNWKERNRQQFAGVKESLPHKILLQDVSNELKALEGNTARSADWKDALLRADLSLQRWTQLTTTNIDSGEVLTHDLSTSANAESINNRGRPPDTASPSIEVRHTPEDFQDAAEDPQSHDLPTMVSRLLHHYDDLLQQTPIWGDTARDGSRPM
ncbi:hypothetical protein R1sor_007467 [Riccia sorocarpa]|uniref:Uncharacterized protein n=1 Tax=Riccia sorocarpa TaxID=122646 RepID=A0ABD3HSQ3_9MARC